MVSVSKKALKWGGAVAVAALATVTLAACGNSSNSSSTEINASLPTDIQTLDMSKVTDQYSSTILGNSESNLLRINDKGKPVPDLAKKVEVSADGLTYTATLRKNLKWSDGSKLTAEDFVYTWQRILDPKTASQYAYLAVDSNIKNAEAINNGTDKNLDDLGVKAEGNKVIFTLTKPTAQMEYFLAFTNFAPQKESYVNKQGKTYGTTSSKQIYSGPYTFKGWNGTNSSYKLVKNKYYWDAKNVKNKVVNYQVVKKAETAVQMYKQGELDFANISATPALYNANKNGKNLKTIAQSSTGYLEYNQTGSNKALANKKIRQALNLATNRSELVKTVVPTGSTAATGLAPTGLAKAGNGEDLAKYVAPGYTYNAKKAKELFKEGLKEIGQSSVKLTITSDADSETAKTLLDYLQGAWEKTLPGLTIEEKFVPFKQRLKDSQDQNFDIVMTYWYGDYPEGSTFYSMFTTGASYNDGKFSNAAYDAAYEKATDEDALNDTKRSDDYKDAEKALMDEANINPLIFQGIKSYQNPKVKGIVRNSTGLPIDFTYAYKTK